MEETHKDRIRENMVYLTKNLEVNESLITHLYANKTITSDQFEELKMSIRNEIPSARVTTFLFKLQRRGPNAFPNLVAALRACHQTDVADVLDKEGEYGITPASRMAHPAAKSATSSDTGFKKQAIPHHEGIDDDLMKYQVTLVDQKDPFFKQVVSETKFFYPMKHKPRGTCVILNNTKFDVCDNFKKGDKRSGAELDTQNIKKFFQEMQFTCKVWKNFSAKRIVEGVLSLTNKDKDYSADDMFVMVLMSHGHRGVIYGTDGEIVNLEDQVYNEFTTSKVPSLAGKPKMFLVQACQIEGSKTNNGESKAAKSSSSKDDFIDSTPMERPDARPVQDDHDKADFIQAYATTPGDKAWRSPDKGSKFIRAFISQMVDNVHCYDVLDILTKVSRDLNENSPQISNVHTTLTKKLYFLPGYYPMQNASGTIAECMSK